jgi:hypothetical protein
MCPEDPPMNGAGGCDGDQVCTWLRCPDTGVVTAECMSGYWSVTTQPCGERSCADGRDMCMADELCVERVGGAFIVDCEANPCGERAIEASCACSVCGGSPCEVNGTTVRCNTCPGPLPCP